MKFNDVIRSALKDTHTSQVRLAEMMNVSQAAVSNVLARNDIYTNNLVRMLDKMGYEVVVQKKTQGRRKEGQMVLTAEKGE